MWPAAAYSKRVYTNAQRRWLDFGEWCLQCDPPNDFPRDLHGVRPTSTYYVAAADGSKPVVVGWQQRDREHGRFGPELHLELMGLRKTADGVWRPQPKLDRRSKKQQQERPPAMKIYRAVGDHRRGFPEIVLANAIAKQSGLCAACGKPFTESDPAVGDHNLPFADGGATHPTNCLALHRTCNGKKGRRRFTQYQRDHRLRDGDLFRDASVKK
jgi:5-methylcytosine-specific restriction endonuclease McrA